MVRRTTNRTARTLQRLRKISPSVAEQAGVAARACQRGRWKRPASLLRLQEIVGLDRANMMGHEFALDAVFPGGIGEARSEQRSPAHGGQHVRGRADRDRLCERSKT